MKLAFGMLVLFLGISLGVAKATAPKAKIHVTVEDTYSESSKKHNCHVVVTSLRAAGTSDIQRFHSVAIDKKDCEQRAAPHRTNLYPDQILSKKVSAQFDE